MKRQIYQLGANTAKKIPILKPILKKFNTKFLYNYFEKPIPIKFSGWGMTTQHEHAWNDNFNCSTFRQTCLDLENFEFTPSTHLTKKSMDELKWRHYFISSSILYSIKFGETNDNLQFVECGVGDGISAFVALNEITCNLTSDFKMHLFDAWTSMKSEYLSDTKSPNIGKYFDLSLERTKSNLRKFEKNIIYHKGFVPETFNQLPESPKTISYLHIDLNSAKPTLDVLGFFYPKLVKGGIIIFDDYGWDGYPDTKNVIDEFFSKKKGILVKLPTGQAIYFHNFKP